MKKNFVVVLFLILINGRAFSQEDFGAEVKNPYTFGVRLVPSSYGVDIFYEIYAPNDKVEKATPISIESFIRKASGKEYSDANPKNEDLFKKYGIKSYKIAYHLWKLRYAIYPYRRMSGDTLGWTGNFENPYMPKPGQMEILEGYGLQQINMFIFGDDFFRLMKDMENPQWRENYKNAE